MCIFRPQGAGNVPRSHSTIESGVAPATGARRHFSAGRNCAIRPEMLEIPACRKILIDFHANEPVTASGN
jgi:hypothetical protein